MLLDTDTDRGWRGATLWLGWKKQLAVKCNFTLHLTWRCNTTLWTHPPFYNFHLFLSHFAFPPLSLLCFWPSGCDYKELKMIRSIEYDPPLHHHALISTSVCPWIWLLSQPSPPPRSPHLFFSPADIPEIPESIKFCRALEIADFSGNPLSR